MHKKNLLFVVLLLIFIGIPKSTFASSNVEIINISDAANIAVHLIEKVNKLSKNQMGKGGVKPVTGGPILVHNYPKQKPVYYVVPVKDSKERIEFLVGIDAKTGDWEWYSEPLNLTQFPPVTEALAYQKATEFKNDHQLSGQLSNPRIVSMPNKKLYWMFASSGTKIFVNIVDSNEIYTEVDTSALGLNGSQDEEKILEPSRESGGSATTALATMSTASGSPPSSYDISIVPHYYQETSWYCCEAALQMIFDYYGPLISQIHIGDVANEDSSYGTYYSDVIRAAHFSNLSTAIQNSGLVGYNERSLGYVAENSYWSSDPNYPDRYTDLKNLISSDYPLLMGTWYDSSHSSGHCRVLKGYNDNTDVFIVHDPWYNAPYMGPDVNFNQAFLIDDLWTQASRWAALIIGSWEVNLSALAYVKGGNIFNVTANIVYPSPHPFELGNPTKDLAENIILPSGYTLVSGPVYQNKPTYLYASQSYTATWSIQAPSTTSSDTMKASAEGTIWNQYSYSYSGYSDRIGGESSPVTVNVDADPPSITITSPQNKTYTNASLWLNVSASETIDTWTYSLNGGANQTFMPNTTITGNEGFNNITVYANDSVGNLNFSIRYFTIDTISPNISIESPMNVSTRDNTPLLNVTFGELVNYTWYNINSTTNSTPIGNTQNLTLNLSAFSDGQHNITVYANDSAGNLNSSTVYFTIDTVQPYSISLNYPLNGSIIPSKEVNFNWTSQDATSTNLYSNLTIDDIVNGSHIVTVNNTPTNYSVLGLSEGLHNWSIKTWDGANNSNSSQTFYFIIDTIPPTVTIKSPINTTTPDNTPLLNTTFGETVNCTWYNVDNTANSTPIENTTNLTVNLSNLEDGAHNVTVYANDSMGNLNLSFVEFIVDTTLPVLTFLSPTPNSGDSLSSGTTSVTMNISISEAHPDTLILNWRGSNTSYNYSDGYWSTGKDVSSGNSYTFYVWVNDTAGNSNQTPVISFSVESPAPPSGGGGGGGGESKTFTEFIKSIAPGETDSVTFNSSKSPYISGVAITAKAKLYNVKISLETLDKKPSSLFSDPTDLVLSYLKITKSNIPNSALEKADIKFRVEKDWLKENDINQDAVTLSRDVNKKWEELPTVRLEEGLDYFYYSAETPEFSYFVITAEKGSGYVEEAVPIETHAPTMAPPTTTPVPITPAPTVPSVTSAQTQSSSIPIAKIVVVLILIVVIAAGAYVYFKRMKV